MELRQLKTGQALRKAAQLIEQGKKREAVRLLVPICREGPKNLPALRLLLEAVEDDAKRAQIAERIRRLEGEQGPAEAPVAPPRKRVALDDLPGVTVERNRAGQVGRLARRIVGVLLILVTLPLLCLIGLWAALYPNREPLLQYDPSWSPDGRRIAYSAWSPNDPLSVWIMNADGSGQTNLFPGNCCAWTAQPDWSPDGSYLVYTSNSPNGISLQVAPVAPHEPRISGPPVEIWCCARGANELSLMGYPRWSPDGRTIAFTHSGLRGPNTEWMADIWTIPAPVNGVPSEARATNITNTRRISEQYVNWSPDGKHMVYEAYVLDDAAVLPHVWSMEIGPSIARPFVFNDESSGSPAWSPDGQWLAFKLLEGGNYDLALLDASRTRRITLTDYSPAAESFPEWSPDGTQLAFVSLYDGNADIWRINADGSNPVNLTPHTTHLPPEVVLWLGVFIGLLALGLLLLFAPSGWQPLKAKKQAKAAGSA